MKFPVSCCSTDS